MTARSCTMNGRRACLLHLVLHVYHAEPGTERYFTVVIHAHSLSRSSVHITSSSAPTSSYDISIDPIFFFHPLDAEILARHVRLADKIAMTGPLSRHLKPAGKRSLGMTGPGDLSDLERAKTCIIERAAGARHPTSSYATMSQELGGVVDPELRLYSRNRLRVCGASIIPLSLRSNS